MSLIVFTAVHNSRSFVLLIMIVTPFVFTSLISQLCSEARSIARHGWGKGGDSTHRLEQHASDQQPNSIAPSDSASKVSMKATAPSDSSLSKKLMTATTVPTPGWVLPPSCCGTHVTTQIPSDIPFH